MQPASGAETFVYYFQLSMKALKQRDLAETWLLARSTYDSSMYWGHSVNMHLLHIKQAHTHRLSIGTAWLPYVFLVHERFYRTERQMCADTLTHTNTHATLSWCCGLQDVRSFPSALLNPTSPLLLQVSFIHYRCPGNSSFMWGRVKTGVLKDRDWSLLKGRKECLL